MTAHDLLERAAGLGVGVVQIADNLPLEETDIDALAVRAQELGIALEAGTCGIERETLERYLEIAQRIGSPVLRTLLDSSTWHPTPEEAAEALRRVAPAFERASIVLAIENHDRFPAATLRQVVEAAGSAHVGVCLDTANSLGCGEGIEQVLAALGGLTVNVHIKDFVVRRLPHNKGFAVEGVPAGRGLLDIPAILARIPRQVSVIVELWPPPEASVEASIAKEEAWAAESVLYLRGVLPVNDCTSGSDLSPAPTLHRRPPG
jgi:sugar phosphate isomerase/epimerase